MRRRMLLVLSVFVSFLGSAHADDWPQFLGPQRNGLSKETGIATWSKEGPTLVWEKGVGAGYSGPVVAGERVIVFHRVGDEEVVECLSAAKGERQWKYASNTAFEDGFGKGNGPRVTPTIAGNRVVTYGADGWMHCFDLTKGTKLWGRNLLKDYRGDQGFFGVGSSPVVADNLVLVNVGGKDAGIVALNLEDGAERWKATKDGASYASPVLATAGDVRHAVFFTRQGAVVLDPKTGDVRYQQRWRAQIDASVNAATPLIIGEQAFFSASYDTGALMLRLTKEGAEQLWTSEDAMSNHYNTCIHKDGYLYGFDGRQEGGPSFRCVELKTRKVMWNQDRFGCGSMILADGKLIVMTERGELLLVEATPKEYKELARSRVLDNAPVRAQIALADGKLYARDQKRLVCLKLAR
jgi:outer membrane protein assembly factor BamB